VFRIFDISSERFITLDESWCAAIFYYNFYSKLTIGSSDPRFLNLNMNVYENLTKLNLNRKITTREAYSLIAPVKNVLLIKKKYYPKYTEFDKNQVEEILSIFNIDKDRIILINPIGYSHKPLSRNMWCSLSKVLEDDGYRVIFNVTNIFSRPEINEWIDCHNAIQVPAHLLPLLSENVRLCLARLGGAFELSFRYSRSSDALIFLLKNKKIHQTLSNLKETDAVMKNSLTEEFGRPVKFIEIDENFSSKVVGKIILDYLKSGHCSRI
jgi:hypothetical protein